MNLGQRDRHRQVVVESRRETFGPRTEFDAARTLVCAQDERLEPLVGLRTFVQRLVRVLEIGTVVRTTEVVPKFLRTNLLEHVRHRENIAQRFGHLLATHRDPAVVQPVLSEIVAGALGLRNFVLVVRKDEIASTTMDVECRPEIELRHGRAFEVPARTAGSPRCRPRGLTGLDGLPEGEVARITLSLGSALA